MWYVLLKFSQNRPKMILFSSRLEKGQAKAKRPNLFIARKLFQKRPNGSPGLNKTTSETNYTFTPSQKMSSLGKKYIRDLLT